MPPKTPPVEKTEHDELTISRQLKEAYEKGYAEGYTAAFPKPDLFGACKQDAVKIVAHDDAAALRQIDAIMERRMTEYGEKMPRQDRELLLGIWKKADSRQRADRTAPVAPRRASAPPEGPPQVEYEVVR